MKGQLADIFQGKVVIAGMGNPLRGDDGLGPVLIAQLQGKVKAVCIDAGSAPENYLGKIAREDPDTILFVDALHLGANAGDWVLLSKDEIAAGGLSTHDISAHMLIDYLEQNSSAKIYMLGVQPKNIGMGEEMSAEVKQALKQLSLTIIGTGC